MADYYMRMVSLGKLQKGDSFDAYQIEVVKKDKGKFSILRYGQPNCKEITVGLLELLQSSDCIEDDFKYFKTAPLKEAV